MKRHTREYWIVGLGIALVILGTTLLVSYENNLRQKAGYLRESAKLEQEITRLKSAPCHCDFVATWDGKKCDLVKQ